MSDLELAREWLLSQVSKQRFTGDFRPDHVPSLTALLARVRLDEAKWWYDYHWGKPQSGKLGIERLHEVDARLRALEQAAGGSAAGSQK